MDGRLARGLQGLGRKAKGGSLQVGYCFPEAEAEAKAVQDDLCAPRHWM